MGVKLGQKWAVKDGNLLASNQVGSRFFNKEFDFSRASNGTYVDRDGLLKTAELYNKFNYSEDFSGWGNLGGSTLTPNAAISPDGNLNATKITEGTNVLIYKSIAAGTYTQSCYAKKGTSDLFGVYTSGIGNATFDLTNGVVLSSNLTSASIQDVGNGWYRCIATSTSGSTTFYGINYSGVDGSTIYVYGAQLVEGTEPLAYQYTNGLQGLPRISFEDGVGHLLLEPQRSNLLLQSNSFDTTWVKFATPTLTSGQSGIYGSNDAWLLTNGGNTYIYQNITTGAATYSIYAKSGDAGTGNILYLFCDGVGGRYFDLANGTLSTEILSGLTDSQIESVGNGWYRCSITFPNSTRVRIYAGESTSTDSIYIQHAQLEAGSYPTSIIETTTTQITRLADVCNNSGSAQDFNSEEGVLYAEIKPDVNNPTYGLISISDGTTVNNVVLGNSINNGKYYATCKSGGTNQFSYGFAVNDVFNKIAVKYKENNFAVWLNGVEVHTDNTGSAPIGLNQLAFDFGGGSLDFYGKVRNLQAFTEALSFRQLKELTGGIWGPYLLDNYTGAAAAYSLRQLNSDTTNVVRVRRSSDNAEADFTAAEVSDGTLESWVNTDVTLLQCDFTDSNSDGLADCVSNTRSATNTIVTGNGHIGNAQRIDYNVSAGGLQSIIINNIIEQNCIFEISFLYRSSIDVGLTNGSQNLGFPQLTANTGDAIRYTQTTNVGSYIGGGSLFFSSWLFSSGHWFEISDLTITQKTSNGLVTTWYDQAGSNNATQATASSQPKIVDAGSLVTENGKAALDFPHPLASLQLSNVDCDSVFAVNKINVLGTINYMLYNSNLTRGLYLNHSGNIGIYDDGFKNSTISSDLNQNLTYWNFNTNYKVALNGGIEDSISTATTKITINNISRTFNLSNLSLGGYSQEIIIYNSDQSSNRVDIETNINDYYNIY